MMKISIITICHNNEKNIRPTIESVINQTYRNIEYIIIDGASRDKTLEIVNKHKNKIDVIISEPDKGLYDAINKGIQNATGDVVGLIHAGDQLYNETVLEKVSRFFEVNDVDALYGHSQILSSDGKKVIRINKSPSFKKSLFRYGWMPSHQSFYAKRILFQEYGMYNLKYKIAADYELLLRYMYFNHIKAALLDEFIVKFSLGGTSSKSVKNIYDLNKECIEAWEDNGEVIPFYTIPMKLLRKIPQFIKAKI